jgi:hypothetical protein
MVAAGAMFASLAASAQVVYTVTVPGDPLDTVGLPLPGTLRYAITAANANCVASTAFAPTINFAISGATFGPGPYAIRPPLGIPLPPLTCDSTTIDATTQSGWSPNGPTLDGADNANLVVILDGSACGSGCSGLEVQAQDTAIKGLSIHSFRNAGIYVASGGYSRIQGNYIGTDPGAMNTSLGNSIGVYVDGGQAVIGGSGATDAQFSNLIAGNAADGILVSSGSSSVQIYGNHIGGNRDGSAGNANGIGVHFASGSSSHEVEQNFIRYNSSGGVVVGSGALFITRNSIHHNNSEGIALFDANAPPPPVITSVTNDGVNTTVSGFVSAPAYPTNPVQVEIFTNSAQPLYPEGETYRDPPVSFSLASGFGTFTATIPGIQPYVTATATIDTCFEDCLSTSEFSIPVQPPVAVGLFNPPLVTPTGTTELVFIVGNPNASSMSGVQYTLVVPLPLKIAAAPTWDADCGSDFGRGSDITAGTVSVFALNLAPGQGCTVHVPVVTPPPRSTPYTIPASSMAVSSSFGSAQPSADAVLIVTEPTLFALPPSVDFGNVAVGTVGSATVSVNNIGLAAGNIAAVTVSGAGFALGPETCSAHTVPPSSSEVTSPCSVTVTFTPASAAPSTGQLLVTYDGSSSPLAVPLLAQGTAGLLQVSPSDVDFGGVFVGDAMTADVTLTNTGNAALNFSSIAISNPPGAVVFTQALSGAPCGSALAAGAACVVRVKFAPAASGTPYSGTLNVASNDPGAPTASIALLGQGTAQAPTVSPPSIAFGNVPVGGSAIIPVTVTNTAQVPLSFLFRVVGAGFSFIPSVPTLCPSPLPPAATCSVAVRFAPTTAGPFTGTFEVDGGGGTTPRLVNAALSGTGSGGSAPVASLSSGTLTFTAQAVGTTSPAQLVVLTNGGTAPLDITSIAIAGDFGYTGCGFPLTLAPGASCTFSVTFSPIANGTRTGSITITDNAAGSPHVVNLVGTGANGPQPSIEVRPFALDFGDVRVGVQHSDVVTITSNGTAPLAISSISIAGPGFTQSNTCPASLPVGGSCQVTVSFVPAATGPYGSTMTIASNADPGNFNVSLAGNGVPTPPAILTVDRFVDFGQQTIGTTTRLSLELRNTGEQALSVNALDLRGAAFGIEGSCAAIVPGGACTVTLVFTPPSIAVFTGSLTIASNDARGAIRVDILGEGVALPRPEIELSVDGIGFANQFITTQSPSQTVSVRSVGSAPLQIHGVSVTGPFVLTGNGCPGTLASGAHCDVSVAFLPFAPGVGQGVLTVDSDAEAGRGFASLTGTGCRFFTIAGLRTLQPLCQ